MRRARMRDAIFWPLSCLLISPRREIRAQDLGLIPHRMSLKLGHACDLVRAGEPPWRSGLLSLSQVTTRILRMKMFARPTQHHLRGAARALSRGFTLIELMVVLVIIGL